MVTHGGWVPVCYPIARQYGNLSERTHGHFELPRATRILACKCLGQTLRHYPSAAPQPAHFLQEFGFAYSSSRRYGLHALLLARQTPKGSYPGCNSRHGLNSSASNTMLVIIGDNGTYAPGVKAPFDLTHAKGYVNQTGVWVPLLVAGRLVNTPDRDVQHMVNVADLFQLFGEIAGLDVRGLVPPRAFSTRYRCCRISPTRDNRVCAAITSLRPASISRRTGSVRRRA